MKVLDKLAELGEKHLGGHITIGPVTIFGFNAMHGQIEIRTRKYGTICVRPPTYMFGRWWPSQFYLSPNHTPWASTFLLGKGHTRAEKVAAIRRWVLWGHGYDTETHDPHREEEFFSDYVFYLREGGEADVCGCCQQRLTWLEAELSNVCNACLVKELARLHEAEEPEEEDDRQLKMELGDGIPWGKVTQ